MDQEKTQTPGWNSNEVALAIQGFNKYGDDFVAISEILGTKSEGSVKAFYNYYKDNYGLDKLIINNPVSFLAFLFMVKVGLIFVSN